MTALIKYEKHIGMEALGTNGTLKASSGYCASPGEYTPLVSREALASKATGEMWKL